MKKLTYGLILLLIILHQDFWWWDDSDTLVFGFLPIGLAYHAAISIAAAGLWAMAVRYCWPAEADEAHATVADQDGGPA
ncbi:MAG: DUF3311 domain-containing protein [Phycisphaerae bacterium]